MQSTLDLILRSLKTLLTTSSLTFLFVDGKELYDRWVSDLDRGDSIYESVFAHALYLPALWDEGSAVVDNFVDLGSLDEAQQAHARRGYADFKSYLAFVGRGIPRRVVRAFHEYVRWDGSRPVLQASLTDMRRFRCFGELRSILESGEKQLFGDDAAELVSERRDRQRLGVYYLTDWVLSRGLRDFSLEEATRASAALSRQVALAEDVVASG